MMRWGSAGIFMIGAAAAVLTLACSSKTVVSDPGADAGAEAAAGATYGASACGVCVAGACSAAIATCNADPTCAANLTCVDACAITPGGDVDPACEAACPAPSGSAGTSAEAALTTCRKQGAGAACTACGASDAGPGGAATCVTPSVITQTCAPSTETSTCNKCSYEKCCDSRKKVIEGGPATDFAQCWTACAQSDYACITACEKKYPAGIQGFGEYEACSELKCDATGACAGSTACTQCSFLKCGCELASCKTDPGCWHIQECITHCATPAGCMQMCSAGSSAAAVDLYKAYSVCGAQKCITECGGGG